MKTYKIIMLTLTLSGPMIPGLSAHAQSGPTRIAVVDMDTVVVSSKSGKALPKWFGTSS